MDRLRLVGVQLRPQPKLAPGNTTHRFCGHLCALLAEHPDGSENESGLGRVGWKLGKSSGIENFQLSGDPKPMNHHPKVALFGVSHQALHIGRACALKDNPVVGVYDPNLEVALKGALFLGTSAQPDFESLISLTPDILLCSAAPPENADSSLVLHLYEPVGTLDGNNCRLVSIPPLELGLPTEITSELPPITLTLDGEAETTNRAKSFLQSLSSNLLVSLRA